MFNKVSKILFILAFTTIISLPLLFTNLKPNLISKIENRKLTNFPELYEEGDQLNVNYIEDFEKWFNDNVGFREWIYDELQNSI